MEAKVIYSKYVVPDYTQCLPMILPNIHTVSALMLPTSIRDSCVYRHLFEVCLILSPKNGPHGVCIAPYLIITQHHKCVIYCTIFSILSNSVANLNYFCRKIMVFLFSKMRHFISRTFKITGMMALKELQNSCTEKIRKKPHFFEDFQNDIPREKHQSL